MMENHQYKENYLRCDVKTNYKQICRETANLKMLSIKPTSRKQGFVRLSLLLSKYNGWVLSR